MFDQIRQAIKQARSMAEDAEATRSKVRHDLLVRGKRMSSAQYEQYVEVSGNCKALAHRQRQAAANLKRTLKALR